MSEKEKKEKEKPLVGAPRSGNAEEKSKALDAARLQIEKQFGKGALIRMGDGPIGQGLEIIPSGSILLDEALGIGGYPKGRIIEIFGPESSGKTTLALHAIAQSQANGGVAAFIDAEHALDPLYAKNLGVDIDELWVSQPDTGEQALEIAESLVRSGGVDIIVVDSVAALTPQAEIDGEMGDSHVGLQARLMSQALRKLTATISKSGAVLVFINQIRMKIGVMFGNPETTTGGNALKFYASIRLDVRKVETINKGQDEAIGNLVRVKVVKNKVAPPFKKAEMEILFGQGLSYYGSLLDCALKYEMVQKSGSWFSFGEERIGQGRDNAREFLQKNPAIAKSLEEKLRKLIFPDRDIPGSKPLGTINDKIAADGAAANLASAAAEAAKPLKAPKAPVPAPVAPHAPAAEGGSELF